MLYLYTCHLFKVLCRKWICIETIKLQSHHYSAWNKFLVVSGLGFVEGDSYLPYYLSPLFSLSHTLLFAAQFIPTWQRWIVWTSYPLFAYRKLFHLFVRSVSHFLALRRPQLLSDRPSVYISRSAFWFQLLLPIVYIEIFSNFLHYFCFRQILYIKPRFRSQLRSELRWRGSP